MYEALVSDATIIRSGSENDFGDMLAILERKEPLEVYS